MGFFAFLGFSVVSGPSSALLTSSSASAAQTILERAPDVPVLPLQQRFFTNSNGNPTREVTGTEALAALYGTTNARGFIHAPDNRFQILFRRGQSGLWSTLGGGFNPRENAVTCFCREGWQESNIRRFPLLKLVTVLSHPADRENSWIPRKRWESFGYTCQGRLLDKDLVHQATERTAIFSGPCSEPFGIRTVEGREVRFVDIREIDIESEVRPMLRHLLRRWRLHIERGLEIPLAISHS